LAGKKSSEDLERITIMLSKKNQERLRAIQAKMIAKKMEKVTFSQVINQALKSSLKNGFKG